MSVTKERARKSVKVNVAAPEVAAPEVAATIKESTMPINTVATPPVPAADLAKQDKIDAPVTVAAPVAPPTAAQIAARNFGDSTRVLFTKFWDQRPQAGVAFVEPDKDAIKALRAAYIAQHNVDVTDMDAVIEMGLAVKAQIDSARAAHAAAAASQQPVDLEWLRAASSEISSISAALNELIVQNGGKAARTPKGSATSSDKPASTTQRSPDASWKEKNPKLIAWAAANNIQGPFLIDKSSGGYEGEFHALRIEADGRFQKCSYTPGSAPVPTGEFVTSPVYWTNAAGIKPKYSPDQMFGILLIDLTGALITGDLNVKSRNGVKPFASFEEVCKDAGI